MSVSGTVYLIHFEPGLHVTANRYARHYLGWTEGPVTDRVSTHLNGRGSPLIAAVVRAGQTPELVRTWPDQDRHFERRLKKQRNLPKLCPYCAGMPLALDLPVAA